MLVLWSLGPVVVVDDLLLLLLVLRSELMLESDDGLVVELELMVELEGADVDVSELLMLELEGGVPDVVAPGPVLELLLEAEGVELMVELDGDDVEVSELIGELEGGLEAPGRPSSQKRCSSIVRPTPPVS